MTLLDPSTVFSSATQLQAEASYTGTAHGAAATWGSFTTLSDDPAQGTAVDSRTPASFDGSSEQFANANNTATVFKVAATNEVSGYALLYTRTAPTSSALIYTDGNIVYDNGNNNIAIGHHATVGFSVGFVIDTDGDTVADNFGGGYIACPTNQWVYAQWYTSAGVLWMRISTGGSQGTWTSTSVNAGIGTSFCGQATGTSNDLVMANASLVAGGRYDGDILSIGAKGGAVPTQADFDGIGAWLQARYPSINLGFSGVAGPTVGTPTVNGHSPADYDGTSQYSQGTALSTYFASGTWSVGFLAYLRAAATDPGAGARNTAPCLLSDSGNAISIAYTASGVTVEVRDGTHSASTLTAACSLSTWHYIQVYWDGTNLGLRIDQGSWNTAAYFNPSALTGLLQIGCNQDQTKFQSMQLLEVQTSATALSTTDWENARLDLRTIYGVDIGGPSNTGATGTIAATLAKISAAAAGLVVFVGSVAASLLKPVISAASSLIFTGTATATVPKTTVAAAGSEVFTGTGAATLAPVVVSASATEVFTGTVTSTLAPVIITAAGWESVFGGVAATFPGLVGSGSGSEIFTGTIAVTLPKVGAAAAGLEVFTGTGSATLPPVVVTAAGWESVFGGVTAVVPGPVVSAAGSEVFTGTGAATLPFVTVVAGGGTGTFIAGTVAAVLAPVSATAAGNEVFTGTVAASLVGPVVAANGALVFTGAGAAVLPSLTVSTAALETILGSIGASVPKPTVAATGAESFVATVAAVLPGVTGAASGAEVFTGSATSTIPAVIISAAGGTLQAISGTVSVVLAPVRITAAGAEVFVGSATVGIPGISATAGSQLVFTGGVAADLGYLTIDASGTLTFTGAVSADLGFVSVDSMGGFFPSGVLGAVTAHIPNLTVRAYQVAQVSGIVIRVTTGGIEIVGSSNETTIVKRLDQNVIVKRSDAIGNISND